MKKIGAPLLGLAKYIYYLLSFAAEGLDGNGLQLEEIGQFFQVLPVYFGEITENRFIVCSSLNKSVDLSPVLYEQFHVGEKVLRLIFE